MATPTPRAELADLLTSQEVAALVRASVDYVLTEAGRGRLRSVKLGTAPGRRGGRRLYARADVLRWIAAKADGHAV